MRRRDFRAGYKKGYNAGFSDGWNMSMRSVDSRGTGNCGCGRGRFADENDYVVGTELEEQAFLEEEDMIQEES